MTPARASFVHIGHGAGSRRVFNVQVCQIEAGQADELIDLPVEMTTARHAAPGFCCMTRSIMDGSIQRS